MEMVVDDLEVRVDDVRVVEANVEEMVDNRW